MREESNPAVSTPVLDEVLSPGRKEWLYKLIKGGVEKKLFGGDVNGDIADELASEMYARLVSKPVAKAFPEGMPLSDGQWVEWLKTDAKWTKLRYLRRQWRHPTDSLQKEMSFGKEDDEQCELTLEAMVRDGKSAFRPWIEKSPFFGTPESHYELTFVHKVFDHLCRGKARETISVLNEIIFNEMDSDDAAEQHGMTANAVYATKFRFNAAIKKNGRRILEMLERTAA